MRGIPKAKRREALLLLQKGLSCRNVATRLQLSLGSVSTIRSSSTAELPTPRRGRPKKISARAEDRCVRAVLSGEVDTATELLKHLGLDCNVETVRNVLRRKGLRARVKIKKPLLLHRHLTARLRFARRHINWTVADWRRVLWSDETKINRFGSDGKLWVWGERGKARTRREIQQTVKHGGGSTMIWGCFSAQGVGQMHEVDGIMDAKQYATILDRHLVPSARKLGLRRRQDFIFQQDNDPKHTSARLRDYFSDQQIQVLEWPAQSPDLNPIEHLWVHLKRQLNAYDTPPAGMLDLSARIQYEWNNIDPEVCKNLVESMPRRLEQVIKRKGAWTDY